MKRILVLCLSLLAPAAFASDSLIGAQTQVKTNSKSSLQAQPSGADGATLANILANNTAPGGANTGGIQVLVGNVQTSAPSYTSGNIAMPWIGTDGRMQVTPQASGTAGTPNIVQLSDGAATYTGTKTGQLPSALGQTTMAGSLSVTMASNQSAIATTTGTASGFATAVGTQTNIASAATTAIACASSLTTSTPTKLYRIRASGAALARCTARYNNNGAFTNVGVLMTSATKPTDEIAFPAITPAAITTGTTGNQQWEINCNNFDALAQDFNVDCSYCISASGC